MRPPFDPLLWELRSCLLSSLDFAEDFAHNRPEYAAAVTCFSEEIRSINNELISSFEENEDSAPSSLDNIVSQLEGARSVALVIAKRHPEKSGPLTRFVEGLRDAQKELIRKVGPGDEPLRMNLITGN